MSLLYTFLLIINLHFIKNIYNICYIYLVLEGYITYVIYLIVAHNTRKTERNDKI